MATNPRKPQLHRQLEPPKDQDVLMQLVEKHGFASVLYALAAIQWDQDHPGPSDPLDLGVLPDPGKP